MRTVVRPVFLLAALAAAGPAAAQQTDVVAFTNVNVIPMDTERVLQSQTVVIRNGRIAQVGDATRVRPPQGARVIDAQGQFLMPGLAEMHAHIPPPAVQQLGLGEEYAHRVLFLYVAAGVTTVRGMLGHPWHLDLRRVVDGGTVVGPRIWTSGPSVNGNSVATPDSALRTPGFQQRAGYDFMKIHPGLTRAVFDSLDAASDRIGMRYAGHVPADVGVMRALEAGFWSIDHLDGYVEWLAGRTPGNMDGTGWFGASVADDVDETKIPEAVRRTRAAGVWNVPTQTLMVWYASAESPEEMGRRPELRYIPAAMRDAWVNWKRNAAANAPPRETLIRFIAVRRQLIKALYDGGAGLLLGSDAPQVFNVPGFAAHRELSALVDAGLTPYQALRTGTVNVAEYFGTADSAGTVAVGKWADLVLVNANPLARVENASQIAGVMVRGRWFARAELDRQLAEIATAYAR